MNSSWVSACSVGHVETDKPFSCEVSGKMIAVYLINGSYYATDNICPHAYALLSDGWLEGDEIECPLHGARFNIGTGAVLEGPAECGLSTYPVRVHNGEIQCLI